ncbi:hypothetical protein Agabi119p4_9642 [Agaricus bisporus var. burnettii]|uniref:Uncharacterized protein n=1 Tax=Agaricus bisporus var. burnettii TaxID=192524 RepID=A0A8H7EXI7_AGABI|nr:hypothetical protein Agabi119p4_9642 [Agaricus bisporus var. burnettii]
MATDAAPELASLSAADKIKQQVEMTKVLNDPKTLEGFAKACKDIGQTAASIDADFAKVKNGFAKLSEKYGKDFPDVEKVYVPRWDGYMARWSGEKGILWSSRTLASKTASSLTGRWFRALNLSLTDACILTDYGENLEFVAKIATEKDLENSKLELKDYVEKHPVGIGKDVADEFKNLKDDVQQFSKDFSKYLEDQRQTLTDEAKKYEDEIKKCQAAITELNGKLAKAAITLVVSFALGIVGGLAAIGPLAQVISERFSAQNNLNKAKANLAKTVSRQKALAAMQADFEQLKPTIDDICTKLGIFADIWTFMTEQSAKLNSDLQEGMKVVTTEVGLMYLIDIVSKGTNGSKI